MKIVIPGGSGQVGMVLARAFHRDGHEIVVLSRNPTRAPWRLVSWDAKTIGAWAAEIDGADVVINLAGRRVVPGRLRDGGFSFCFPSWAEAAHSLCRQWRQLRSVQKRA